MNSIIDGKSLSEQLLNELKSGIIKKGIIPGLAVILVGNNEASAIYVRKKVEAAKRVDINAHLKRRFLLNPLKIKSSPPLKNTMPIPIFTASLCSSLCQIMTWQMR